jgi:hypothetical protein
MGHGVGDGTGAVPPGPAEGRFRWLSPVLAVVIGVTVLVADRPAAAGEVDVEAEAGVEAEDLDPNRPGAEMQIPDAPPAAGGIVYDPRPPIPMRSADGAERPEWFPILGPVELGCTTGNPNPSGVVDTSCHQVSAEGGGLVPYHPWPAIDLATPEGTPVRATGAGTVVSVGHTTSVPEGDPLESETSDEALAARAGGFIVVAHADGPNSVYKHVGEWLAVPGDHVEPGQVIGLTAYPGTLAAHLHYDEQDPDVRFNAPEARVPFDTMLAGDGSGQVVTYPDALGTTDWNQVRQKTVLTTAGWGHPTTVSSEAELRAALATLSASTDDGPFTVNLGADIALTGGQLDYTGDELLMIDGDPDLDGARRGLTAGPNSRVVEAPNPDAALELRGVDLTGNGQVAGDGGLVNAAGPVTVVNADLSGGQVTGSGGAVSSGEWVSLVRAELWGNGTGGDGGGVRAARAAVADSTVHGNIASGAGGGIATTGGPLAGVHIGGEYAQTDANRLSNSTISGNQSGLAGGGFHTPGDLYAQNATIHQNSSTTGSDSVAAGGRLTTSATAYSTPSGRSNCQVGSTRSLGGSLDSGTSCGLAGPFDIVSRPARLGALRINTGPTPTHYPLSGSPLVDAFAELPDEVTGVFFHAPPCSPTGRSADQRSSGPLDTFPRLHPHAKPDPSHAGFDGLCDIGAIEALYPGHGLSDVPAWIEPATRWITSSGRDVPPVMTGYPGGTFRPDLTITRAQVANALYGMGGRDIAGLPRHSLLDVPLWVDDAVTWITHDPAGPASPTMTGYPDQTYRAHNPITRGEFVRAMHRLAGELPVPDPLRFPDVPAWIDEAVRWITADPDGAGPVEAIMTGYPDGTFRPDLHITRAQWTRALHRLARTPEKWNSGNGTPVDPDGVVGVGFLPGVLWAPL